MGMSTNPKTEHRLGIGKQARIPSKKLKELIDGVPDVKDPAKINYWVKVNDEWIYLEGWSDACLAGTGFPPIEGGEWDEKIDYIKELTPGILRKKAKEYDFELIIGGFIEKTDEDFTKYLYGITYGVYRRKEQRTK